MTENSIAMFGTWYYAHILVHTQKVLRFDTQSYSEHSIQHSNHGVPL